MRTLVPAGAPLSSAWPTSEAQVRHVVQKDDLAADVTAVLKLLDEVSNEPTLSSGKHQRRNFSLGLRGNRLLRTSIVPTQRMNSLSDIFLTRSEISGAGRVHSRELVS